MTWLQVFLQEVKGSWSFRLSVLISAAFYAFVLFLSFQIGFLFLRPRGGETVVTSQLLGFTVPLYKKPALLISFQTHDWTESLGSNLATGG